jgi:gliding motility-associated lipoprotein GldH
MSLNSTALTENNHMGSLRKAARKLPGIISSTRFFLLYIPATLVLLYSCGPDAMFDHTKKIPGNVWKEDELIRFEVPVHDTVHIYKFFLNLRHTTDYEYANVFFFINTTYPDGTRAKDTVECILADKSGKWLGNGITNIRDIQVMLRRGLRFPQTGTFIFEFEQAMREPELYGIKDIGFRIEQE